MEILNTTIAGLTFLATIFLGLIGYKLTKTYSNLSDRISSDTLFHSLFRDFNTRYGYLNAHLKALELLSKDEKFSLDDLKLNSDLYDKAIDYLNLCAEEYYWYKQGRVNSAVWNAWSHGMNYWYSEIRVLREVWEDEIKDDYKSYYLKEEDNLFNKI
ncbi:MAG: hypothetical protein EOO93_03655 [Pedobacter sp.]|nr:MAG: hypothetical protein EOO93_03655 [Pedobacter sp.]